VRTKRRGQDLRRIRRSQCYSITEIGRLLNVTTGTVGAWLGRGLPSLEGERPILVPGDGLKSWLIAQRQARKRKCQPDELYCCRCRVPSKAKPGSVLITPRNTKTLVISAVCSTCDAKMNRGGSLAKLPEIQLVFGLNTPAQVSLAGCENPAVNQHLEKETLE
jgi:hypothetical protein